MRTLTKVLLLVIAMALLVGCAAGSNPMEQKASKEDRPAGFWRGLWHGIIAPFTFVISLFSDNVHLYEVYNNGNWYNFGFVLGAGILFGGGSKASSRRRRDD